MQIIDYLQRECTRILSLVVSPGCSPVSPQGELPVGTHHPRWLRLQSKTERILCDSELNTDCPTSDESLRPSCRGGETRVDLIPAMRPITPDVLMMSPVSMFSVAIIHLFRLPPATRAMSADLCGQHRLWRPTVCVCVFITFSVHVHQSPAWWELTCMGRIALQQPSLQTAGPLCSVHSAAAESLSTGIFVYGHRRCHVSVSFLCGREKDLSNQL